ncbi:MAG: CoA pyrophosphatase [Gammaproteobacteria bacterium]|nr:MAG: CoA pyrophosphatase [Gammaproteobacteria bacterium]
MVCAFKLLKWCFMDIQRLLTSLEPRIVSADTFPAFPQTTYKLAAVLIPLVRRKDGLTILLTKRNENLKNHPGQVCFPGGKVDGTDASPAATAVRECFEELGFGADKISVHGMMQPIKVPTGYIILPVIGEVEPDYQLNLHYDEVELAFEVPFTHFLEIENYIARKIHYQGRNHRFIEIKHDSHYIWGATAKILRKLSKFA